MATAQDVLRIARGELGYYAPDDPEAGSKYGRWMADLTGEEWLRGPSKDIWWCNMFVSWVLAQAGVETPGYPSYNTDVTLSAGPALVYREDLMPGDIVIWDWNGDGATDHVGIVEEHTTGTLGQLITIEGNKNNAVKRVDRSDVWGYVRACIRPNYAGVSNPEGWAEESPVTDWVTAAAYDVIDGRFGNGVEARKEALFKAVQDRVNQMYANGEV